jgi:uncharacterized membrane protein YbhN (UPF0104 family)
LTHSPVEGSNVGVSEAVVESPARIRSAGMLALKLAVTGLAFGLLFWRQPLPELWAAARGISLGALVIAVFTQLFALFVGTVRWRALLHAYGAREIPAFSALFRVYLVGYFYNTYLPGAVGGDFMRGVLTRKAFGADGTTRAVAVVFVERVLGLAGLMALTSLSVALLAQNALSGRIRSFAVLAMLGALLGVLALSNGRRLARFAPARLAGLLDALPELQQPAPFVLAMLLSIVTHTLVALCGHVLIQAMLPSVTLSQSLWAMPLAAAAGYFPFTVAGAGTRDLAMVQLYMSSDVPRATAVATALAFLLTTLIAAGIGGLLQWIAPLELRRRDE